MAYATSLENFMRQEVRNFDMCDCTFQPHITHNTQTLIILQVSQLQFAIVLRRSPPKQGCQTTLHYIFLCITYRPNMGTTRLYTVRVLEFPQVPRGTLQGQQRQQQALKFLKSPKNQKSQLSQGSHQTAPRGARECIGIPTMGTLGRKIFFATPRHTQRCPTGSAQSKTYWSNH